LDAVHVAGLGYEGVLSLIQNGAVSTVNVDDNWVDEMFLPPSA